MRFACLVATVVAATTAFVVPARASVIFSNMNSDPVTSFSGGPPVTTQFTVLSPVVVSTIDTYHFGSTITSDTVALFDITTNTSIGTWASQGPGSGYNHLIANVNVAIAAGTYQLTDGSPGTWSYNANSGLAGMATLLTPAPEPWTLGLIGSGLVALAVVRRRR